MQENFRAFENRAHIRNIFPCTVINPFTVSVNSTGKKRIILDLKYKNLFVWKKK